MAQIAEAKIEVIGQRNVPGGFLGGCVIEVIGTAPGSPQRVMIPLVTVSTIGPLRASEVVAEIPQISVEVVGPLPVHNTQVSGPAVEVLGTIPNHTELAMYAVEVIGSPFNKSPVQVDSRYIEVIGS